MQRCGLKHLQKVIQERYLIFVSFISLSPSLSAFSITVHNTRINIGLILFLFFSAWSEGVYVGIQTAILVVLYGIKPGIKALNNKDIESIIADLFHF